MKAKRHEIKPQTLDIWRLSNQGMSGKNITKALGLNRGIVSGAINRGRKSGHCNKKVRTKVTCRNESSLTYGYIGQVIDALSLEQLDWLFVESEAVGYNTCAEYIAELVQDAYEEAMAKEANQ